MIGSPNFLAYIVLFLWIPATLIAFARLRPALATMVSVLGGVMFLPEALVIDPPLLPPIDKLSITTLWTFVGCAWKARGRLLEARPLRGLDALFVLVLLGNLGTAVTNSDALVTGPVVRQGLTLYDAFASSVKDVLSLYLPFFLARAMLRTSRDLNDLTRLLVAGGLVYALLALIEVRMSPQLHRWVYGYHQMDFSMTMRFGGYRPMVFMLHGLATALFVLCTALAAWARYRAGPLKPWGPLFVTAALVLCKSTGAIVYGIVVIPVVALLRKPRMGLPSGLAFMVLLFPALRSTDVFPTDTLVEQAERISEERALSLWFRFDQEDQLLERARERFLFGWGTYDRNHVFDPATGEDLSITDGDWIIQVGTRGLMGFFGLYGILGLSIVIAKRRLACIPSSRDRILLSALALISAIQTVDLLPNGLFHYLPFFFAGAVAGLSDGIAQRAELARRRVRTAKARARREARRGPSAAPKAACA